MYALERVGKLSEGCFWYSVVLIKRGPSVVYSQCYTSVVVGDDSLDEKISGIS